LFGEQDLLLIVDIVIPLLSFIVDSLNFIVSFYHSTVHETVLAVGLGGPRISLDALLVKLKELLDSRQDHFSILTSPNQ
jgi:hypothetical protein